MIITKEELARRQNLPLAEKIEMSQCKIEEWWKHWDEKVYVSFSGGKDSTVLLHLVRSIFPSVPAMFLDTGLEYPEIKEFVKSTENVITVRPKMSFREVIEKYGYPVISKQISLKVEKIRSNPDNAIARYYSTGYKKDGTYKSAGKIPDKWMYLIDAPFKISWQCCNVLKKNPATEFGKKSGLKPYLGVMASDSPIRSGMYLHNGCNAFDLVHPYSAPLSFWLEKDIWEYIKMNNLPHATIYDKGLDRTGCMWCMFGIHMEKKGNRFQLLKRLHPKLYEYCMNDLGINKVLDYLNIEYDDVQSRLDV